MNAQNVIQSVTPQECPHCNKPINIVHSFAPPVIENVLTEDNIKKAKETVIKRLDEIKFKEDKEKGLIIDWIKSEQTMFGEGDVETILKNIAMQQLKGEDTQKTDGNTKT